MLWRKSNSRRICTIELTRLSNLNCSWKRSRTPTSSLSTRFLRRIWNSNKSHSAWKRIWRKFTKCTRTSPKKRASSRSTSKFWRRNCKRRKTRSLLWRNRSWHLDRSNRTTYRSLSSLNRNSSRYKVSKCRYLNYTNFKEAKMELINSLVPQWVQEVTTCSQQIRE